MQSFNDALRTAFISPSSSTEFNQLTVGAATVDIFASLSTAKISQVTKLVLKAAPANTGTIFVGVKTPAVTTRDFPLAAGDVLELACNPAQSDNVAGQVKFYAIGSAGGQTLAVIAVIPTP